MEIPWFPLIYEDDTTAMAHLYQILTHKPPEKHGCVLSTEAADDLVLKHQAIDIHSADKIFIILEQLYIKNTTFIVDNIRK